MPQVCSSVNGFRKVAALALIVAAVAVVALPALVFAITLFTFWQSLSEEGTGDSLFVSSDGLGSDLFLVRPGGPPGGDVLEKRAPLTLSVELISVDPATSTASAIVRFLESGSSIMVEEPQKPEQSLTSLEDQYGTLFIGDEQVQVPYNDLTGFSQTLVFDVSGNSAFYPGDWYRIDVGEVALGIGNLRYDGLPLIPLQVSLGARTSLQGSTIQALIEVPVSTYLFTEKRGTVSETTVIVKRDRSLQLFVWAIAVSPLLILLVVLIRLFRPVGTAASRQGVLPLELAIAVIAILPLRQVLVPSAISGLTLVDFLLGTLLAAFIAVVAVQNALDLFRVRKGSITAQPSTQQVLQRAPE